MKFLRTLLPILLLTVLCSLPLSAQRKGVDDPRHLVVKFSDNSSMAVDAAGRAFDRTGIALTSSAGGSVLADIAGSGGTWRRFSGASESETESFCLTARVSLGPRAVNLNSYLVLTIPEGIEGAVWARMLGDLPEVERIHWLPLPTPPPVPPNYRTRQGYLDAATNGIDAAYAWSIGVDGSQVNICDFEYSWNLAHQDLPAGILKLLPAGYSDSDPFSSDNHGTSVLGELVSRNNGWGTTGGVYGSSMKVAPTYLNSTWDVALAMTNAMTQMIRGDVFLIEHQIGGPAYLGIVGNDTGLVPVEWYQPWYDVIVIAVGNGFHVVEAAGNGYQNLDSSLYRTANGGHWPFMQQNNSGAIIVGAGAAPAAFSGSTTARSRLAFSNYGSRLDLQGWGEKVTTTGGGGLYSAEGKNLWYDSTFAGTSSASPIVTAAVALVETRFENLYAGQTMAPATMRSILVATGSAQQSGMFPSSQKIGPLPNVQSAMNFAVRTLAGGTYTVGASRQYVNLTAVANELRNKILTGNVIFEIYPDYAGVETLPIEFNEFTSSGGLWSVTIRPASSMSQVVTAGMPPGNHPYMLLNGIDRLTLDGRPGGSGSGIGWIIRNARTDSLAPAVEITNDATYNVLRFLQLESENTVPTSGTLLFGSYSGNLGNSYNSVRWCHIRRRSDGGGLHGNAIYSDWTSSIPNTRDTIENNEIYDWTSNGMLVWGEQWMISYNSLYQTITQPGPLTGIWISSGNGHRIEYNAIGGSAAGNGGVQLSMSAPGTFVGISLTVDTLTQTLVRWNGIQNILTANSASGFSGILTSAGLVTVSGNLIGDTSGAKRVIISGNGTVIGVQMQSARATIHGNHIANIDQPSATPGEFRGIYYNDIGTGAAWITSNLIHDVGPVAPAIVSPVRGIFIDVSYDTVITANNMIALGRMVPTSVAYDGIFDNGTAPWVSLIHRAIHNSVEIIGMDVTSASSSCFRRAAISRVTLLNNAFSNIRSAPGGIHSALASHQPMLLPSLADNNIYYTSVIGQEVEFMFAPTPLQMWRTMSGFDAATVATNPQFKQTYPPDLHVNPAVYSAADNRAMPFPLVSDDFDGQARGPVPDIGADEYTINAPSAFSHVMPGNGSGSNPVNGTLAWNQSAAAGFYDVYLDSVNPPVVQVGFGQSDTFYLYSGLDSAKIYYWSVTARNSSNIITGTGSPWSFGTVGAGSVSVDVAVRDRWNLISNPMIVPDLRKDTLFPSSTSNAFAYEGSYAAKESLENGKGYWLKFGSAHSVTIWGTMITDDTISVSSGWNLIGSISIPIAVSSIGSSPGGIVTSGFYGYAGAYGTTDSLRPGHGYWVKVDQDGELILSSSGSPANGIHIQPTEELPPAPPEEPVVSTSERIPEAFALAQNFPNPFNPTTLIGYALPVGGYVSLKVYNMLGGEIATLVDEEKPAGVHEVVFDAAAVGEGLATGVYIYRLISGSRMESKKLVIMR
jgi:serine protease